MTRPLLITDCDEVLLHMVVHFGAWLDESHDIDFSLGADHDFSRALTRRPGGEPVAQQDIWPLLDGFFATEMHRQTLAPHAADALAAIARIADVVVLTNLLDHCHAARVAQLEAVGIRHRVVCNQGGKGLRVRALIDEYRPSTTVFVDDLPQHHESVAEHAPEAWRLHMIVEPILAPIIGPAPFAHARIDDWRDAETWIAGRMAGETAATIAPGV